LWGTSIRVLRPLSAERATLGMLQVCGNFSLITYVFVVPRVGGAFAMLAFGSRVAAVRKEKKEFVNKS
jgi:hypothetical protein